MNEDKLSKEEQELFNLLSKEKKPPYALEKKLLNKLKDEGLIIRNKTRIYIKWAASIAASALLFISGVFYEKASQSKELEVDAKLGYLLLLREDDGFTPGEPMNMFNEYRNWMISTLEQGVKIKGQELKDESINVDKSGTSDLAVLQERTTGYFILEAESLEQAVLIAQENPHIKYGGIIEVKPFMIR